MIFAANRCRDRAPNIYIADDYAEIANIVNPRLGDVAFVIASGVFQSWRLVESESVADGLETIQSNACEFVWVIADESDYTFDMFGAVGDAETDDTEAFDEAFALVPAGATLRGTPGKTYLLDGAVASQPLTLNLTGITLLHKPLATAPMITLASTGRSFVFGGVMDGNKANQAGAAIWRALLQVGGSADITVRDTLFQNGTFAGIRFNNLTGEGFVQNCQFRNFAEHGGVLNDKLTTGIWFQAFIQDARPRLTVKDCKFIQDSAPSVHGKAPGGIIVQGSDAINAHPSVTIKDNYFQNIGQDFVQNHIGCIDLYEDVLNAEVSGNKTVDARYVALKLQNCGRLICSDNILVGNGTDTYSVILYDPQQRIQAGGIYDDTIIKGNIINDPISDAAWDYGIVVQGINGKTRKVSVVENHITGPLAGIVLQGAIGSEEPILIGGNTCRSSGVGGAGIVIANCTGNVRVSGNDSRSAGGNGLAAITGVETLKLHLENNILKTDTNGSFGAMMRGVGAIYAHSGCYANTGGGTAVNIQQNSLGALVGELAFDLEANIIEAGAISIVSADISRWRGISQASGSPEAAISAVAPLLRYRNDIASLLIKSSGAGNTGWRSVFHGNGASVVSGDYLMKFTDTFIAVAASLGNRIIDLPPLDAMSNGRPYFVSKSDATVNTVTIRPAGADVLNGGNVVISTQFQTRMFIHNGVAWFVI